MMRPDKTHRDEAVLVEALHDHEALQDEALHGEALLGEAHRDEALLSEALHDDEAPHDEALHGVGLCGTHTDSPMPCALASTDAATSEPEGGRSHTNGEDRHRLPPTRCRNRAVPGAHVASPRSAR